MENATASIETVGENSVWTAECPCCNTGCSWQIKAEKDDYSMVHMDCPTCGAAECEPCKQEIEDPETQEVSVYYRFQATRS